MSSHRVIPPKMLMRMALTRGLRVMMRSAFRTFSGFELPPTSRKFAGLPPKYLMRSMVAMERPAPLTMHPIVPSSPT